MNTPTTPNLGNVMTPDLAWVAKLKEAALEPELPIVDPHHHLWQRAGNDYMFHDLLADTQTGHNIVATVFVDCHSMYRADGPGRAALRRRDRVRQRRGGDERQRASTATCAPAPAS